ncbi:MAG: hypothetical protein OXE84_09590 [Rhodobacteraceae bacterium]|nr:hypothetical protein [Paracoccaceae bacterium]
MTISDRMLARGERGATLLEAALAVALFGTFLAFVNGLVREESDRQRDRSLGQDLRLTTQFAQQYVATEYDSLRASLAQLSSADAIMEISMRTMANAGYLPPSFLRGGEHRNNVGQKFAILVRGVSRADRSNPKATLAVTQLDSDIDGRVDAHLTDGNPDNDELDLEVLLVTSGGQKLPAQHGNPAAAFADLAAVGYVQKMGRANGPFGSWSMDITPFQSLASYPTVGHFVSLLALSGFGALDFQSAGNSHREVTQLDGHPFERCLGLTGSSFAACAATNDIHTTIRFQPSDTDNDGSNDRFASMTGLHKLAMARPVDSDADGTIDLFSEVTGLLRIACGQSGVATASTGTILMECAQISLIGDTEIGGSLTVSDDTEVDADLTITGEATGARFVATALGGQDLTKGIFHASLVNLSKSRDIIKPDCQDADSEAQIFVAPAAYASPDGSPVVGLKAIAEEHVGGKKWTIRMQAAIDRDRNSDRKADVIELRSSADFALALTKCS